jgi:RNA polymerase sigma factor (sigma-70 family)
MVAAAAPPALDVQTAYALLPPSHRRAALRRLRPRLPHWLDAEDLDQMVWEALGRVVACYQPQAGIPPEHYVCASFPWALRRVVRRTWPRRSPQVAVFNQRDAEISGRLETAAAAAPWPDFATAAALAELLRQLPPRPRQVLWLHAVEGHSFTAIAKALGCRRSTVWDWYCLAIMQARAFWDEAR